MVFIIYSESYLDELVFWDSFLGGIVEKLLIEEFRDLVFEVGWSIIIFWIVWGELIKFSEKFSIFIIPYLSDIVSELSYMSNSMDFLGFNSTCLEGYIIFGRDFFWNCS